MKTKRFVFFILAIILITGCGNKRKSSIATEIGSYNFETMYKDSFDILINQLGDSLTLADTLYTEMYIAWKTRGKDSLHISKQSCDIVIDRVGKLMAIDTVRGHQRGYLNVQMMVYRILKNYDKFMETEYQYWNTYPDNSLERLSNLGCHFLVLEKQDSANYYFNKAISVADNLSETNDADKRLSSILTKVTSLVYLKNDKEALTYLQEQVTRERDERNIEYLESTINDFDVFKKMLWASISNIVDMNKKMQNTK